MTTNTKSVLVLGAGLVSRPLVRYLLDLPGYTVTVASRTVSKAVALIEGHARGKALAFDINDEAALDALVSRHDLSVSLLPADYHPEVAKACLRHGKHMATTSYIAPAMRALSGEVEAAGLVFLNECGVDPGIDHMSAMRIFDDVRKRGGKVRSFKSYCGGLPAPDADDNPLGYKFSWAPRGVLVAAKNNARYLKDGELVETPGPELFSDNHLLEVDGAGTFEAYPNLDSMGYVETYGLEGVETMFRGTLRNLGHCVRWKAWVDLGLFDDTPRDELAGATYACVLRLLLGLAEADDPRQAVAEKLGLAVGADPVETLGWLGFYDKTPLPEGVDSPMDALAAAMLARMRYADGERDMIVMHHEVVSEVGGGRECTTMDLVDYGIPHGDSSMARTVSLPVAIGVRMILDREFTKPGVHAPVVPAWYEPILDELETLDIVCKEATKKL